jgi:hypothetical protein
MELLRVHAQRSRHGCFLDEIRREQASTSGNLGNVTRTGRIAKIAGAFCVAVGVDCRSQMLAIDAMQLTLIC